MITVYTVNKRYGDPIEKRKALKITGKTVTFENGSRENLSNDYRSHFKTLDAAVEYFELWNRYKNKFLEDQLKQRKQMKAFVDALVTKERGEA